MLLGGVPLHQKRIDNLQSFGCRDCVNTVWSSVLCYQTDYAVFDPLLGMTWPCEALQITSTRSFTYKMAYLQQIMYTHSCCSLSRRLQPILAYHVSSYWRSNQANRHDGPSNSALERLWPLVLAARCCDLNILVIVSEQRDLNASNVSESSHC